MKDGLVIARHLGEVGVDVQRVAVTREAVDGRLLGQSLHLYHLVRCPLRRHVLGAARAAVAAESALAPDEGAKGVDADDFARLILRLGIGHY